MPINRGLPSAPQKPAALAKLRSALQNMQHALNLMAVTQERGSERMTFGKAQGIPETRKCRKSNINPLTV
ncbi:MAG: hypothetical protein GY862_36260 [Gammaproteobacteria bacterium]|nr:hypothetical protein [Gammaproteobacteria bacterium]